MNGLFEPQCHLLFTLCYRLLSIIGFIFNVCVQCVAQFPIFIHALLPKRSSHLISRSFCFFPLLVTWHLFRGGREGKKVERGSILTFIRFSIHCYRTQYWYHTQHIGHATLLVAFIAANTIYAPAYSCVSEWVYVWMCVSCDSPITNRFHLEE